MRAGTPIAAALTWAGLAVMVLAAGCRGGEQLSAPTAVTPDATARANAIALWPVAPAADALRKGGWQGGPDPASGKLRSGISTYYRFNPEHPKAGKTVQVDLRFETVEAGDATVSLTLGDGAQWANSAPTSWRLPKDTPSQVTLQITVPAGDSYLHVMTAQNRKPSVKSILLAAPR